MKDEVVNTELKMCQMSERIFEHLHKENWKDDQILEYLQKVNFNQEIQENIDLYEMSGKELKEYFDNK